MRGSLRLFSVFGISINIHASFLLLLLLVLQGGIRWVFLTVSVFCFVTLHELCHALVAKRFGIPVREITLLPIGGVASLGKMPEKPSQEFMISIAGPLFNIFVIVVFFYPLKAALGADTLFHPLSTQSWPLTFAYIYWINLMLAAFNLLPAFPMDGGRILRAVLARRMGYQKATKIAANLGQVFSLLFVAAGIVKFNIMLIIIALFIYVAASGEEAEVDVRETLKKFRVRDILPHDFSVLRPDTTLASVLEMVFHSRQEDFPVVEGSSLRGFVTRQDIMTGIHRFGVGTEVGRIMRTKYPLARETDTLAKVQAVMHSGGISALPVTGGGKVIGVVTLEDIGRIYAVYSQKMVKP